MDGTIERRPIIRARGLGYQSGDRYRIKDINWEIEEKSRWIVLGMNGSGKTTLLSIMAGYQDFSHGNLFYRDTNYRDMDILELRKKMGWISNSYFDNIYQNESVCELILAGLTGTLGMESTCNYTAYIPKLKRLLQQVGLEDRLDYPYSWLSKGERQNVLILRALLQQPETLVLDEPMTGLDVVNKQKMMQFVQRVAHEQKRTMLYVTHHFEEISSELFDHCMLMRQGKIYRLGTVDEILREDVISDFLKQPVTLEHKKNGYYQLQFNKIQKSML